MSNRENPSSSSLFRMLNIRAGLEDMNHGGAMQVLERIRNEIAAELRTTASAERFAELALRLQAVDISLDALMGK